MNVCGISNWLIDKIVSGKRCVVYVRSYGNSAVNSVTRVCVVMLCYINKED